MKVVSVFDVDHFISHRNFKSDEQIKIKSLYKKMKENSKSNENLMSDEEFDSLQREQIEEDIKFTKNMNEKYEREKRGTRVVLIITLIIVLVFVIAMIALLALLGKI